MGSRCSFLRGTQIIADLQAPASAFSWSQAARILGSGTVPRFFGVDESQNDAISDVQRRHHIVRLLGDDFGRRRFHATRIRDSGSDAFLDLWRKTVQDVIRNLTNWPNQPQATFDVLE